MNAIIAAAIIGVILMFTGITVKNKQVIVSITTVLLFVLLGINGWSAYTFDGTDKYYFNDLFRSDRYSLWFNTLITGATLLYVMLLGKNISRIGVHVGEYFSLIVFILLGVYLLSGYNNMLVLFLGIEILSIPQYILAGSDKKNLKSSEASLKYFLMGAFSTGILLMGITLLYGATGSFQITNFTVLHSSNLNPIALAGIVFMIIAFGFKASAAPMHIWTPDVYDGAPTAFTAYMATIVKVAVFVGFMRLFHTSFGTLGEHWQHVIGIIIVLTLLVGNLTAVFQQSVKRMLAYSSIAQAGFMLFSIFAVNAIAWQGMIVYAVAYSVASIGLFSVLVKLKDYTYDGFNGLAKKEPLLAFFTVIFLLSLTGIPLTGGFMAKYLVLNAAIQQGQMVGLVIFALIMAAISAYYYFRVIIAMYFKSGDPVLNEPVTKRDKWLLAIAAIIIIWLGVYPVSFF